MSLDGQQGAKSHLCFVLLRILGDGVGIVVAGDCSSGEVLDDAVVGLLLDAPKIPQNLLFPACVV
ncbi:MAG: hypothetical protein AAFQ74_11835 [Cyanobacteria bacterium J06623_4]